MTVEQRVERLEEEIRQLINGQQEMYQKWNMLVDLCARLSDTTDRREQQHNVTVHYTVGQKRQELGNQMRALKLHPPIEEG